MTLKKRIMGGIMALITILMLFQPVYASDISPDELEKIKKEFYDYYAYSVLNNTAMEYVNSQLEDGTWDDINYNHPTNKTATAYEHLRRLLYIVQSSNTSGHELYKDRQTAIAAIDRGFAAWKKNMPLTMQQNGYLSNMSKWWNDTIGQQIHCIIPIIATGYEWMSEESMNTAIGYLLGPEDMHNYPSLLTGANYVWYLQEEIIKDVFSNNLEKTKESVQKMLGMAKISYRFFDEGIKTDNSFQQHGPDFYTTYSGNFELYIILCAKAVKDTSLENKNVYPVMADMLLDGDRWLYHGGEQTPLVQGRQMGDKYTAPAMYETSYTKTIRMLAQIYPEKSEELMNFKNHIEKNEKNKASVKGNKYFWCSDIMIHKRDGYSVVTRLSSEKTRSTESNAAQNRKGEYVGFGTLFLTTNRNSQNPYRVFFDWGKLPGVTGPDKVSEISQSGTFIMQNEKFVGGVSDGEYGATAMKLNKWHTLANKACFFFDDCYAALGSGISTAEENVSTGIDQRALTGNIYVNNQLFEQGEKEEDNVSMIYTDSASYYFPNPETLNIKAGKVKGKWSDIGDSTDDTEYEQNMFVISKPHKVNNDDYCYIVYPSITREEAESIPNECKINIVSNTKTIQAVYNDDKELGYAVFYESGSCKFKEGLIVKTDTPCILMIRKIDDKYYISVSEPTLNYESLNITLNTNGKSMSKRYDLPENDSKGQYGGSTVTEIYQ